jgi:SPP1 family predicted phage head-tail adaptor
MTAGDLNERVSILTRSETSDSQGGRSVTWVDVISGTSSRTRLYANVKPLNGVEQLQGRAMGSTMRYLVTVNYRDGYAPSMRVEWRPYRSSTTKTLEIHSVSPLEGERRFFVLDCAELV